MRAWRKMNQFVYKKEAEDSYRDEQMRVQNILLQKLKDKTLIKLEHWVTNLERTEDYEARDCKPDVLLPQHKIVIRLMGEYHKKPHQRQKDEIQKIILEHNDYTVFDFWYDEMTHLWKKNRNTYDDEQAEKEVMMVLGDALEN